MITEILTQIAKYLTYKNVNFKSELLGFFFKFHLRDLSLKKSFWHQCVFVFFSSWQSQQCEHFCHQFVILTAEHSASGHSGSAPRADNCISSPDHVNKPSSSNCRSPRTASTCKCVKVLSERAWMDLKTNALQSSFT